MVHFIYMNDEEKRKLMEGFINDTAARRAEQEALRKKQEQEAVESPEEAQAVQQGVTTLSRMQSYQAANNRVVSEGMANLGRNPEEVVIGKKRTDWDLDRINQKQK